MQLAHIFTHLCGSPFTSSYPTYQTSVSVTATLLTSSFLVANTWLHDIISKGATRLGGTWDKKQVWRPMFELGLSEANVVVIWLGYLAPSRSFGARGIALPLPLSLRS